MFETFHIYLRYYNNIWDIPKILFLNNEYLKNNFNILFEEILKLFLTNISKIFLCDIILKLFV